MPCRAGHMPFSRNQPAAVTAWSSDQRHEQGVRADGRAAGEQQPEDGGQRGRLHARAR